MGLKMGQKQEEDTARSTAAQPPQYQQSSPTASL